LIINRLILLSVVVGFSVNEIQAQDLTPPKSFRLNLDYAKFRYDNENTYLEIYYAFYPYFLTYRWSGEKYRTGVQLRMRLKNNETNTYLFDERSGLQVDAADTTEATSRFPFVTQAGYAVPFGDYTLEVVANDSLAPSRRDSVSFNISANAYPAGAWCSDLELCSTIKSSQKRDDPFFKNSLEVVPNPTLVFGVTARPVVFHYVELYNLDPVKTYTVKQLIIDPDGEVIREASKTRNFGARDAIEVGTTNVTSIFSGRYQFHVLVLDDSSQEIAKAEKTFYVYNPHLQVPSLTDPVFQEMELAGLSEERLTEEFQQARYLATEGEIEAFAEIISEDEKRKFLAEFWVNVESGESRHGPISRADYLKRVEKTNERYPSMGKKGWRSDRGRIYILYGPPDEIDRYPSAGESKPYEIWRYHSIESGVEFIYINRWGFGDYELVHSTKRDELRNEQWQNYLR